MYASNHIDAEAPPESEVEGQKPADGKKKPRYCGEKLGDDPTKCPAEEFEWKGKGRAETGRGSWVKNDGLPIEESLHPDLIHPPPKDPHWDYVGPEYPKGAELYLDGTWKPKDFK